MPLRSGDCLGTHNGTVVNADALFRRFRLRSHAEVDSELIFRLASRLTGEDGWIDVDRLIEKLARFKGQMSAMLVSRRDPGTVLVLKGDMPLSLWLHPKRRVVAYASSEVYLCEALADGRDRTVFPAWVYIMPGPLHIQYQPIRSGVWPQRYDDHSDS